MNELHRAGYKFQARVYLLGLVHTPARRQQPQTEDEMLGVSFLLEDKELCFHGGKWLLKCSAFVKATV